MVSVYIIIIIYQITARSRRLFTSLAFCLLIYVLVYIILNIILSFLKIVLHKLAWRVFVSELPCLACAIYVFCFQCLYCLYLTVVTCAGKHTHQQFTCAQVNMHISGSGSTWVNTHQHFMSQINMHISIYDLVPKGAHARGYALQLKIKHCWKLFIWNVVYLHKWMNI